MSKKRKSTTVTPIRYPADTRGVNAFDLDRNLQRLLARRAPAMLAEQGARLSDFGAWVGGALEAQAVYSDRIAPPRLETHGRDGDPLGRVIFNPAYEACHAEVYRRGVIGLAFGKDAAPHLLSFSMGYLLSTADISIHCPVTMTGALAHVLARVAPPAVRKAYLPQLTRTDGQALSGGTWATELHGGSDVGATATEAVADGKDWRLTGLKWFASNAGCGLAFATARPRGAAAGGKGLGCYLVPATLPAGGANALWIRRLKDKLGTRGLATAEVELRGAWAQEVAAPPHGLKAMMAALEYSRIHNAVAACAVQRRAFIEAVCWASHRQAFGATIVGYPMVRDTLLDLIAELEANMSLAFEAAATFDAALADDEKRTWLRTVTALAKYRTAEYGVRAATRAVELLGGNGYTEEWPTARLYRDALVLSVWEGPVNIQALELLRMVLGKVRGDALFLARVDAVLAALPDRLAAPAAPLWDARDRCAAALAYLHDAPDDGPRHARRLLEQMADCLAAALLLEEAVADLAQGDMRKALVAERFVALRFGGAPAIGPARDPAHDVFDQIVGYGTIAA